MSRAAAQLLAATAGNSHVLNKYFCSSRLLGVVSALLGAGRTLIRSRAELQRRDPAIDGIAEPEPAETVFTVSFLTSC